MKTIFDSVRILAVDDNPKNLRLLIDMLSTIGYDVRVAINGETALAALTHEQPDLILLDINMPDMDGYEVARRIQANPNTADIPFIFLSALNDSASIVKAFEHGGVDYIAKPFKFEEVAARINTHLTLHFQRQQLEYFNQRNQEQLAHIQQSEAQYRDLFDNASDMIQSVDAEGRFLYVNPYWHHLLGYAESELPQLTLADIIHPDHREECLRIFANARQKANHVERIETVFISKSGQSILVQGNINFKREVGGKFHTRGILRDVTEQKELEHQALLLELERRQTQILADLFQDISHELRTPLSVIKLQLFLLHQLVTEEKALAKINLVNTKADELESLIQQLQTFVELNATQSIGATMFSLNDLVKEAVESLSAQISQSGVDLRLNLGANLPDVLLNASLMRQAVIEVITNGLRYAGEGGGVAIETGQTDNRELLIRVQDNGPGIEVEHHSKIFKPLFKVNDARTTDGSGAGIGLSMVKSIMALHGGEVTISSKRDAGSLFELKLRV